MWIQSPHCDGAKAATPEAVAQVVAALPGKEDPFAIVGGLDDQTYMQTLWTPEGFVLEYQEGSVDQHYRSVRRDLGAADVIRALCKYVESDGAATPELEFQRVKIGSVWFRLGYWVGQLLGSVKRGFDERRRK